MVAVEGRDSYEDRSEDDKSDAAQVDECVRKNVDGLYTSTLGSLERSIFSLIPKSDREMVEGETCLFTKAATPPRPPDLAYEQSTYTRTYTRTLTRTYSIKRVVVGEKAGASLRVYAPGRGTT